MATTASTKPYAHVSEEEFDEALDDIVYGKGTEMLMQVPGVYEALSEEFNNEVLEKFHAFESTCKHCDLHIHKHDADDELWVDEDGDDCCEDNLKAETADDLDITYGPHEPKEGDE